MEAVARPEPVHEARAAAAETPPPLSVVVATTQPWPELRACLDAFWEDARALGAEVVVLDRDGRGLPGDVAARYPGVVRISEAGASIYRLRSLGLARAHGEVVLITEDHCIPRAGWCAGHLRAHREHPEVAAVGGPVDNGARRRLIDWAIFLKNHAGFVPPVTGGPRDAVDRANISYKRALLPREPSPDGRDEPWLDRRLSDAGHHLWLAEDPASDHVQSFGLRGTLWISFQNGRAVAGLRMLQGISLRERIARLVTTPLIPPLFFLRTLRGLRLQGALPPRAVASLPLIAAICVCVGAGNLAGYLAGPGASAAHLR